MKCKILSLEYFEGEKEGATGLKKGAHPFIKNGTGYDNFISPELVLSVVTNENEEIDIDIRKRVLNIKKEIVGHECRMSKKLLKSLSVTKPEYVDVFKEEDYYVSKTSLRKWVQSALGL